MTKSLTYDFFISHASEDKQRIAEPLRVTLERAGYSVWIDTQEIRPGDSLVRKIELGLRKSRYALLIATSNFFRKGKYWTHEERDALASLEASKKSRRVIPVRHGFSQRNLNRVAPLLGGRLSVSTDEGLAVIVSKLATNFPGKRPIIDLKQADRHLHPFWRGNVTVDTDPSRVIEVATEFLRFGNEIFGHTYARSIARGRHFNDDYQVTGRVTNDEFISFTGLHSDDAALNLIYTLLRLSRTGDEMTGKYIAVSRNSEQVVSGDVRLSAVHVDG